MAPNMHKTNEYKINTDDQMNISQQGLECACTNYLLSRNATFTHFKKSL
jgi:hypothetical protein